MAPIVVLTGGGLKSAVAAACSGRDRPMTMLHVTFGQRAAEAELAAARRLAPCFPGSRVIGVDLGYLLQFQCALESGASAKADTATGVVGTRIVAGAGVRGLWPAIVWSGIQCAFRIGADRVVSGLSRRIDAAHLGMPPVEAQAGGLHEVVYELSSCAEFFSPAEKPVQLELPLIDRSYDEIVKLAAHVGVEIEHTWTCIGPAPAGGKRRAGCGHCPNCNARAAAFIQARCPDPLEDPGGRAAAC